MDQPPLLHDPRHHQSSGSATDDAPDPLRRWSALRSALAQLDLDASVFEKGAAPAVAEELLTLDEALQQRDRERELRVQAQARAEHLATLVAREHALREQAEGRVRLALVQLEMSRVKWPPAKKRRVRRALRRLRARAPF